MGAQGIVASLCPIHVTEQGANDPLFGYRPAVATLLDRLKNALASRASPPRSFPTRRAAFRA
ncbi:MAG: hypothetical protein U0169_25360 [Polyangiaceae bacterium]